MQAKFQSEFQLEMEVVSVSYQEYYNQQCDCQGPTQNTKHCLLLEHYQFDNRWMRKILQQWQHKRVMTQAQHVYGVHEMICTCGSLIRLIGISTGRCRIPFSTTGNSLSKRDGLRDNSNILLVMYDTQIDHVICHIGNKYQYLYDILKNDGQIFDTSALKWTKDVHVNFNSLISNINGLWQNVFVECQNICMCINNSIISTTVQCCSSEHTLLKNSVNMRTYCSVILTERVPFTSIPCVYGNPQNEHTFSVFLRNTINCILAIAPTMF